MRKPNVMLVAMIVALSAGLAAAQSVPSPGEGAVCNALAIQNVTRRNPYFLVPAARRSFE